MPTLPLPHFNNIEPATIPSMIKSLLDKHREQLKSLLTQSAYSWENLMRPLEDMDDELSKIWSPIGHLHAVMETDALRQAYNDTLPHLTEYATEFSQNEALYNATASIANSADFKTLSAAQRKILEHDLRDFKLSGVNLSADKKKRVAELEQQLSQLTTKFSENVLDATHAYTYHTTSVDALAGLPEQALQLARDNAKHHNLEGYVITLDYPSYSTALKFLKDRELRKTLYEAYSTRASDLGPNAHTWDNTEVINGILNCRKELAELIGYKNYADYSLVPKMAKTSQEVLTFLQDLLTQSRPIAQAEYQELLSLAKKVDNITDLAAWDASYYSEKLQESKFQFTQEDLRPYFPIDKALQGMFSIVNKLYGITIQQEDGVETWHPDVRFFTIRDEKNELRGGLYTDLYARPHKRDGAWMDECVGRRVINHHIQQPIAFLTCNFMPPVSGKPALLTHDDVITLFHEFGHCLHHLLTKVDYASAAGINGVAWDAVEFPSQFMENYCWDKKSLALIAEHYETKQPLPDDLYQKMLAAKHFQTGLQMVRQLEFSIFDFRLHLEYDASAPHQVQKILDDVRNKTSVIPVPEFNRFQNSFAHIFAGGYAAGYYSYKWAEVLSSDAYEQFEEHGIYDRNTGKSFMENILEVGGSRDPMESFIAFRGRAPKVDALLRLSGIKS